MVNHEKKIHRNMLILWSVIVVVLFAAYLGEVLKGFRSIRYFSLFMLITFLPLLGCIYLHRRNLFERHLSSIMVCGYFVMYTFVLLTGSTAMVFTYILPMLSFLVLAHRSRLVLHTGIASLVVNLISIAFRIRDGEVTMANSKDVEIQLALILLCFLGAWVSARMYEQITRDNEEYLRRVLQQSEQISSQQGMLKEMQTDMEQISEKAYSDPLTGIGNRLAFEQLTGELDPSRKLGILFCDINALKYHNDTEGHKAGDRLLLQFTAVLTRNFRHEECFRISGDEFLCVLPGIEQDTFELRAREFHRLLWDAAPPPASLGWAYGSNPRTVLSEAEKEMYIDKQDFYQHYPEYRR